MKCLTELQSKQWIASHSIQGKEEGTPDLSRMDGFRIRLPETNFQGQEIAKQLFELAGEWNEALLWIFDWPFYRPEQMAILNEIRKANQETRELIDARSHLFLKEEKNLAIGIAALCLMYSWDFKLITHPLNVAVLSYTHDEIMEIYFHNEQLGKDVEQRLKESGIKIIE